MGKRGRATALRAYAGERMVDLPVIAKSGVSAEQGGPWSGQETKVSYPGDGKRVGRHVAPWEPTDDPVEASADHDDPLGLPPLWTEDLVRAWMGEALATIRRMSGKGCFPSRGAAGWPEWVRDVHLGYNSDGQVVSQQQDSERRLPTMTEMARLDVALTWPYLVGDVRRRQAMLGVAMGLGLRTVAKRVGVASPSTVSNWASQCFADIADELNRKAEWGREHRTCNSGSI